MGPVLRWVPPHDTRQDAVGHYPHQTICYLRHPENILLPELSEAARRKGTGGGVCGNRTYKGHIRQMFLDIRDILDIRDRRTVFLTYVTDEPFLDIHDRRMKDKKLETQIL